VKVSITGHTESLGKSIFENLSQKHSVSGYSKSTGWDFDDDNVMDRMIEEVGSSDVFINSAFHCQWLILPKVIDKFKFNEDKLIINIGSFHSYTQPDDDYGKIKNLLKQMCFDAQADPEIKCRVVNISPSLISRTNASIGKESIAMLSTNDVCRVINFIIDSPPHFLVNEMAFSNKDLARSFHDS